MLNSSFIPSGRFSYEDFDFEFDIGYDFEGRLDNHCIVYLYEGLIAHCTVLKKY